MHGVLDCLVPHSPSGGVLRTLPDLGAQVSNTSLRGKTYETHLDCSGSPLPSIGSLLDPMRIQVWNWYRGYGNREQEC